MRRSRFLRSRRNASGTFDSSESISSITRLRGILSRFIERGFRRSVGDMCEEVTPAEAGDDMTVLRLIFRRDIDWQYFDSKIFFKAFRHH
jgi:hypothetical protein